jgi:hypothetical protein
MKRVILLKTEGGERVVVHLDHWGCGTDKFYRRWMWEHDVWICTDTGEFAHRVSLLFGWLATRGSEAGAPA